MNDNDQSMKKTTDSSHGHPLDRVYDRGYFYGESSGYSKQGYEHDRPTRIDLIQCVKPHAPKSARWLDAGCAYGYQAQEARRCGFEAYGIDVSSYALQQKGVERPVCIQGIIERLPFQSGSFDVVSAFDVIEHLLDPQQFFDEIDRVLTEDGFFILATPDPIHFRRPEQTHVYERPPSYWVYKLSARGYTVELRFGSRPYEVELIASRQPGDGWESLCASFQTQAHPNASKIHASGLRAAPRRSGEGGWRDGDMIYALNDTAEPARVRIECLSAGERHCDLFLGDLKLRYDGIKASGDGFIHQWRPVSIAPGGKDIRLRVDGDPFPGEWRIDASPMTPADFTLELAFDHYQRYRFAAEILQIVSPDAKTVLDVGGALGCLPMFAPGPRATVIDRAWEDTPWSQVYEGATLPFEDDSFDAVVSIDTLEHLPQDQRELFIDELSRVARGAVVVCGPFDNPAVEEAERALRDFNETQLDRHDRFLNEHAEYELPSASMAGTRLEDNGFHVMGLPNGYLPRWLAMQFVQSLFSLSPEMNDAKARLNAIYNANFYNADNQTPAYRIAVIGTSRPLEDAPRRALSGLMASGNENASDAWNVTTLVATLAQFRLLAEKETYIRRRVDQEDRLLDHIRNLEESLKQAQARNESLQGHAANLEGLLKESQTARGKTDGFLQDTFEKRMKEIGAHADNLKAMLDERDERIKNLDRHVENLEQMLAEQQKHAVNLGSMFQEKESHVASIEQHAAQLKIRIDEIRDEFERLAGVLQVPYSSDEKAMIAQFDSRLADWRGKAADIAGILEADAGDSLDETLERLRHKAHVAEARAEQMRYARGTLRYRLLRLLRLTPSLEDGSSG